MTSMASLAHFSLPSLCLSVSLVCACVNLPLAGIPSDDDSFRPTTYPLMLMTFKTFHCFQFLLNTEDLPFCSSLELFIRTRSRFHCCIKQFFINETCKLRRMAWYTLTGKCIRMNWGTRERMRCVLPCGLLQPPEKHFRCHLAFLVSAKLSCCVAKKNISFEQSWFCILVILSPYVSDPEESIHALETGILAEGLEWEPGPPPKSEVEKDRTPGLNPLGSFSMCLTGNSFTASLIFPVYLQDH